MKLFEIPHIDVDNNSPLPGDNRHFDILDISIEKMNLSQSEKTHLIRSFYQSGIIGKTKYGFLKLFNDKPFVTKATQEEILKLDHLPDDWESFMLNVKESKIPTIKEVFVIRENSVGNIVKLLKLTHETAKEFDKAYGKFAFPMASIFKNDLKLWDDEDLKLDQDQQFLNWSDDDAIERLFNMIKAFPVVIQQVIKLNSKEAIEILLKKITEKQSKELKDRALITSPDGFYWVKLYDDECSFEGSLMQHCGRAQTEGGMYSLRDPSGNPHVTLTATKNTIHELAGKQNKFPDKKYWKYIAEFIWKTGKDFSGKAFDPISKFGKELDEFEVETEDIFKSFKSAK